MDNNDDVLRDTVDSLCGYMVPDDGTTSDDDISSYVKRYKNNDNSQQWQGTWNDGQETCLPRQKVMVDSDVSFEFSIDGIYHHTAP